MKNRNSARMQKDACTYISHNLCGSGLCVRGGPFISPGNLFQVSGYILFSSIG